MFKRWRQREVSIREKKLPPNSQYDSKKPMSRGRNRITRLITKGLTKKSVTWSLVQQLLIKSLIKRKRTPNLQSKSLNQIPDSESSRAKKSTFYMRRTGHTSRDEDQEDPRPRLVLPESAADKYTSKNISGFRKSSSKWERERERQRESNPWLQDHLPFCGSSTNDNKILRSSYDSKRRAHTLAHTMQTKAQRPLEPEAGSPVVISGHRGCNV
jgi:hypothetical protein